MPFTAFDSKMLDDFDKVNAWTLLRLEDEPFNLGPPYGYTLAADFTVAKEIAEGRFVRLLPDYIPVGQPIFVLYAHRRYIPRKVRAFVDYLTKTFQDSTEDDR